MPADAPVMNTTLPFSVRPLSLIAESFLGHTNYAIHAPALEDSPNRAYISPMRRWDKEEVFFSGDAYYAALLYDIELARRSVRIEVYILQIDRVGKRLLAALERAVERGVRVRLLIDGVGSYAWTWEELEIMRTRGVTVRVYHPLPWQTHRAWFLALLSRRWFHTFQGWVNRRNHRKTILIDDNVAYVGGMNFCESQSVEFLGSAAWRDTMVRLEGGGVYTLRQAFELAWQTARRHKFWRRIRRRVKKIAGFALVRLNYSRDARWRFERELLRRIERARRRIWIPTPYLVPPPRIFRALRVAAWMGADVRILVPEKCDVRFMKFVGETYYSGLISAGVRIFEYRPAILHAKTTLIDDWITVGSANFNHRSFLHDLEVEVRLTNPSAILALERQFLSDIHESREVLPWGWRRRMFIWRITERIMLRFRYWI